MERKTTVKNTWSAKLPKLVCLTLEDGQIGCTETSATNCQSTLRNIPEERRSALFEAIQFPLRYLIKLKTTGDVQNTYRLTKYTSRNISVGIVTMLWAAKRTNYGSIPGKGKGFFSSPKRSVRLCCLPILLLTWLHGVFSGCTAAGAPR